MGENRRNKHIRGMAVLLAAGMLLTGCSGSDTSTTDVDTTVAVEMQQAQTGDLVLTNSFVGTITPMEMVYVIPMANGIVTETYYEVGDEVQAGDILFQIDDTAARLQLEQAQLTLTNARQQANMALGTQQESTDIQLDSSRLQVQSSYEQAQIQYFYLQNSYNDMDKAIQQVDDGIKTIQQEIDNLEAGGGSSTISGGDTITLFMLQQQLSELQSNKATLESSKKQMLPQVQAAASAYRAAEESLNIANKSAELTTGQALDDTKAQLSTSLELAALGVESAELALSYYAVEAPISGTIQTKGVEVNGVATSSNPAYVITNEDSMTVTFQVSEAVKNTLQIGQSVEVERGSLRIPGSITEIGQAVNQQTGLFQVKATVLAAGDVLPSGVSVKLYTNTYRADGAVLIPYDAVYYDNEGSYIYLCVEDTAVKTYVETGLFDDTTIEIISGIAAGDTVITSWSPRLTNGAAVAAVQQAE